MRSHKTRSKRDRSIPRSLQRWVSSKILDLAASWRSSVLYHSSEVVTVYQRTIYCEYCQCTGQDRIAHTSSVWYHRVHYGVCGGTHRSPTFFVYYMGWSSRSYACTSYHTLRSLFGRTGNFKDGLSAIDPERPLLIPSIPAFLHTMFDPGYYVTL